MLFSALCALKIITSLAEVDKINNVNTCHNAKLTRATQEADHQVSSNIIRWPRYCTKTKSLARRVMGSYLVASSTRYR